MTTFTKDDLIQIQGDHGQPLYYQLLAAYALAQTERAEKAEARMKAWGCPEDGRVCLNCGRETPCMTEDDLKPGDPGTPCTFDMTYPQMIELLHFLEDKGRKAEAELYRLTTDYLLTRMEKAEAERDRLAKELGLVLFNANRVLWLLNKHGASIIPHLMDDDDNPGEEIRKAVRRARERKEAPR